MTTGVTPSGNGVAKLIHVVSFLILLALSPTSIDVTDLVGTLAQYHEVRGFRFRDGLFVVPFVPRESPEGEFVAQHADHCIDWYDL